MGRINLEPSQTTASKHWTPHRIPTSVWAGFGSSVVIITYFSFLPRRPSTTRSILVQQYSSNTHVVEPWEHVLKIAPGFPSEPIRSTPTVVLPRSASPVARLSWDAHSLAVCIPELSFEHSMSALELASLQPTPQHTDQICHACLISQSILKRTMIRLLAAVVPKEPILSLGAD